MALNSVAAQDKIFYTTGRLTSEIKTMKRAFRSLPRAPASPPWGVELARRSGLTLIRPHAGQALYRAFWRGAHYL